ncbi:unnamed protein product [Camellia sinensis]
MLFSGRLVAKTLSFGHTYCLVTRKVERKGKRLRVSSCARCTLPRVKLLNFEVTPTDEDCTVQILSCKMMVHGNSFINSCSISQWTTSTSCLEESEQQEVEEAEDKETLVHTQQETKPELEPKEEEVPPLISTDQTEDLLGLNETNPKAAELEKSNALALAIVPPGR